MGADRRPPPSAKLNVRTLMSKTFFSLLGGFFSLALLGCGESGNGKHKFDGHYPIKVVCTTGMVADLVKKVGGDHVRVEQLMAATVDPHTYEATSTDVHKLHEADVIFYSGLHLEGHMGEIFAGMKAKRPTCAVAEKIDAQAIQKDEKNKHDPHVWFDVSLWSQAVGVVRDVLVDFDPRNAEDYKTRAKTYQDELARLHEEVKAQIATIPKAKRVLVTCHDAFRYFGRAYDIEVRGIKGISTDAQTSLKDVNDLVDFITAHKFKAVFMETSVSDRDMKALIRGCAAKGHAVVIGGELFSDAMGPDGTPEGTYPGMIRHNVKTIVQALK